MEIKNKVRLVVHCADIHIRTYRLHDEYKVVFNKFFDDIREMIVGYDRSEVRIVVAGDLVHQKIVISNEQLMLGTWFLIQLEEIAPVILIAGNHDCLENNKDRMDSLSPMVQFLGNRELSYFKESKCYADNNIVWCVYSIFESNKRPNIEVARQQFGDDKTYIGLFHGPIIGSVTDIGYVIEHGYGLEEFDGLDIVICGDIHKRQNLNYNGTQIVFSGSLIQQSFGETISNHGYLLWDVETKTFIERNIDNPSPYYQFKVTSIENIENGEEELTNL